MIPESGYQDWHDLEDRSAYRRVRHLCMMPADAKAFSDALRAELPEIRFVSRDYWEHFIDQQRWKRDCLEYNRRRKLGLPELDLRRHMRDPTGETLRYWDSFADPAERWFLAWIEPPGWRPIWSSETTTRTQGIRHIENVPRLWFEFKRSDFIPGWPERYRRKDTPPEPASRHETTVLEGTHFEVRWNPTEPEAEAFAKKVYNLLRKITVSRFIIVHSESRRAFTGKPVVMLQCLAGRHAVAWAMKRRHNYLKDRNTLLKPAGYPFRRSGIFSPAEYMQLLDDDEAELEAIRQRALEASKQESRARRRSGETAELDLLVDGTGAFRSVKMRIPITKPAPRNGK